MVSSALPARIAFLCILTWCLMLASCEKEVQIDLDSGTPKLVVEGVIESGLPPYVVLTRSIGFLSRIDLSTMENTFVHGASVTVSDGSRTVALREYAIDTGFGAGRFRIYSIDTTDPAAFGFLGEPGRTYTLTIGHEGRTYDAVTSIPQPAPLDSLWTALPEQPTRDRLPDARVIFFRYKDPDTFGNYVRYYTRKNSALFYPAFGGSVFNDEIVNGTTVINTVSLGFDRSRPVNFDSSGFAFVGDTITVKWCSIDRPVYDFWSSYEYASNTVGSPFTSPINLRTNIKGGALGVWAGYSATFHTIVVRD